MTKRYDVVQAGRKYKTRDGQEKTQFTRIGSMFETKNGFAIVFDALPVASMSDKGTVETRALVFEPRDERGGQHSAPRTQPSGGGTDYGGGGGDDDIPFAPVSMRGEV